MPVAVSTPMAATPSTSIGPARSSFVEGPRRDVDLCQRNDIREVRSTHRPGHDLEWSALSPVDDRTVADGGVELQVDFPLLVVSMHRAHGAGPWPNFPW